MTYFRTEAEESPTMLRNPEYRTKLVRNTKGVFFSNLVRNHTSKYGLDWVGHVTFDELTEILEALPEGFQYNDFDLGRFVDALEKFGIKNLYFGREGSVVAYIYCTEDMYARKIASMAKADECDEESLGLYRLWWD